MAATVFPKIAQRVETPILIMINRRNVLTVLGLMLILLAISLLVRPCNKWPNASFSRIVRLNCSETGTHGPNLK